MFVPLAARRRPADPRANRPWDGYDDATLVVSTP
jgi:hypothetical protein